MFEVLVPLLKYFLFRDRAGVHDQGILAKQPSKGNTDDAVEDFGPAIVVVHAAKTVLVIGIYHKAFSCFITKVQVSLGSKAAVFGEGKVHRA